MTWIPWIKIEPENSEKEAVHKLYQKARKPLTGKLSDLTQLTSLSPEMSNQLHSLGVAVYRDAGNLNQREKEVAALVTSSLIGCVH
jgi:predicted flap endonuclease-1-like 5' DNA nuclease